jgi:hypothetical protein
LFRYNPGAVCWHYTAPRGAVAEGTISLMVENTGAG